LVVEDEAEAECRFGSSTTSGLASEADEETVDSFLIASKALYGQNEN
jgi:hypothetical protein